MSLDVWREGSSTSAGTSTEVRGFSSRSPYALELPVSDRDWFLERIGEQRTREARELEKAARRR